MALVSQASRRYAEAVLESALLDGDAAVDTLVTELEALSGAFGLSHDLTNVLMNPAFSFDERNKVLEALIAEMKLSPRTRRFLFLLSEKGRIDEIEAIAESVKRIADERVGRTTAFVESASELSESAVEQLKKALEKRSGKKLDMVVTVNPDLIGGVRARVDSFLLDGTIQTELARLREQLAD